jgi:hypothetical protein
MSLREKKSANRGVNEINERLEYLQEIVSRNKYHILYMICCNKQAPKILFVADDEKDVKKKLTNLLKTELIYNEDDNTSILTISQTKKINKKFKTEYHCVGTVYYTSHNGDFIKLYNLMNDEIFF